MAGGYFASTVNSMLDDRAKALHYWLESVHEPVVVAQRGEFLGTGVLEKASLDIFHVTNLGNDTLQLVRTTGTSYPLLGEELFIQKEFLEYLYRIPLFGIY